MAWATVATKSGQDRLNVGLKGRLDRLAHARHLNIVNLDQRTVFDCNLCLSIHQTNHSTAVVYANDGWVCDQILGLASRIQIIGPARIVIDNFI